MTAEQLFAERGIEAVPLRDIGITAGQKNHAVVQYHFGDRESLVREVIAFRASLSERLRVEMFADLVSRGQPQVCDLVRVFVLPMAAHLEQHSHYLAFMSRYITERGGYRGLESIGIPSNTVATLRSLLGRLLPGHPETVLEERWTVVMTSTIHTLACYQAAPGLRRGPGIAWSRRCSRTWCGSSPWGLEAPAGPRGQLRRGAAPGRVPGQPGAGPEQDRLSRCRSLAAPVSHF